MTLEDILSGNIYLQDPTKGGLSATNTIAPNFSMGTPIEQAYSRWKQSDIPLARQLRGEQVSANDYAKDLNYQLEASLKDPLSFLGTTKVTGLTKDLLKTKASKKGATTLEDVIRTIETPKNVNVPARFLSGEKAGNYRGTEAFGGINPQQLGKMRAEYLNKMEKGVGGRNWYDESSTDISRWVGGNPTEADKVANMLAITSAETPVASN